MDIHKPKPWHGVREFLKEYLIIVVGVLTALAAEQAVEWLHWQHQVKQAEDAMQDEVRHDLDFAYERLAVQPCLTSRVSAIVQQLRGNGPGWRAMTEPGAQSASGGPRALPVVYARPGRPWYSDAWDNAKTSGALSHMSRERVARYSVLYSDVAHLRERQIEEVPLEAGLAPLAFDTELDRPDRNEFIARLGELDRLNGQLSTSSAQFFSSADKQGIRLSRRAAEARF